MKPDIMVLTPVEIQRISQFCNKNGNKNVVIESTGCGIGDVLTICTQEDFCEGVMGVTVDITDYESW